MNTRFESLQRGLENTAYRAGQVVKTTGRFILRHSPEFMAGLLAVNTPDPLNAILRDSESSRQGYSIVLSPGVVHSQLRECVAIAEKVVGEYYLNMVGGRGFDRTDPNDPTKPGDEIKGPAVDREYLVRGGNTTRVLKISRDSLARELTGKNPDGSDKLGRATSFEFRGQSDSKATQMKGKEALLVTFKDQQNGDLIEAAISCGAKAPIWLMSEATNIKDKSKVVAGPTSIPPTKELPRTPGVVIPQTKQEVKSEVKLEAKPETKPEVKPAGKPGAKPEPKPVEPAAKLEEPAPTPVVPAQPELPGTDERKLEEQEIEDVGRWFRNVNVMGANLGFRPAGDLFDGLGRLFYYNPIPILGDVPRGVANIQSWLGWFQIPVTILALAEAATDWPKFLHKGDSPAIQSTRRSRAYPFGRPDQPVLPARDGGFRTVVWNTLAAPIRRLRGLRVTWPV